jgi:hypothetical protein
VHLSRTAGTVSAIVALAGAATLPVSGQDQPAGTRPGWPCVGAVDPVYVQMAEGTGGRVVMLHPSELAAPGAGAVSAGAGGHDATIVRVVGQLENGLHEFDAPIDSTVESVNFLVSLQCLQLVTIAGPTGREIAEGDPSVSEDHRFDAIRYVTLTRPEPGRWKITVAGKGLFFMIVTARTGLSLGRMVLLDPGRRIDIGGRAVSLPEAGKPQRVEVRVDGAVRPVAFRLISSSAATLQTLALEESAREIGYRTYRGSVTLPAGGVRLAATGIDERGFPFQRVDPPLVITAPD